MDDVNVFQFAHFPLEVLSLILEQLPVIWWVDFAMTNTTNHALVKKIARIKCTQFFTHVEDTTLVDLVAAVQAFHGSGGLVNCVSGGCTHFKVPFRPMDCHEKDKPPLFNAWAAKGNLWALTLPKNATLLVRKDVEVVSKFIIAVENGQFLFAQFLLKVFGTVQFWTVLSTRLHHVSIAVIEFLYTSPPHALLQSRSVRWFAYECLRIVVNHRKFDFVDRVWECCSEQITENDSLFVAKSHLLQTKSMDSVVNFFKVMSQYLNAKNSCNVLLSWTM